MAKERKASKKRKSSKKVGGLKGCVKACLGVKTKKRRKSKKRKSRE